MGIEEIKFLQQDSGQIGKKQTNFTPVNGNNDESIPIFNFNPKYDAQKTDIQLLDESEIWALLNAQEEAEAENDETEQPEQALGDSRDVTVITEDDTEVEDTQGANKQGGLAPIITGDETETNPEEPNVAAGLAPIITGDETETDPEEPNVAAGLAPIITGDEGNGGTPQVNPTGNGTKELDMYSYNGSYTAALSNGIAELIGKESLFDPKTGQMTQEAKNAIKNLKIEGYSSYEEWNKDYIENRYGTPGDHFYEYLKEISQQIGKNGGKATLTL